MQRVTALLTSLVVALAVSPLVAAPGQAAEPAPAPSAVTAAYPGVLQGVYYERPDCLDYGRYGVQQGMWDWWFCEDNNGMWWLWTFTY
ncbi:hypothetical protein JQS43_13510 [Natronosporangium hydrolyticum]|uniref:Secreted protein n=1 Tax=Natronosporangium hydrolyticum TaxID=2811111 RepID=A0A895Y4T5_9ACTN|nr:hypothetical protein [Natronosporangium hydrolyticum]QSB12714.1 hypothetical protein JQS43_13510 [Natronosporangium hydrolyticum]